jgi:hypothetical protein
MLRRITEEDAEIFFTKADRPPATDAEIRGKVPECYHDLLQAFLPAGADALPPQQSYDHKIEILPGNNLPYSKNRPMSNSRSSSGGSTTACRKAGSARLTPPQQHLYFSQRNPEEAFASASITEASTTSP